MRRRASHLAFGALLFAAASSSVAAQRTFLTRDPCGGPLAADSGCVVTLGTGTPAPNPDASGPSTAVVVGPRVFVFDAGPGTMRRMAAAGFPIDVVTRLFLTHLHSDHTLGLPDVILTTWVMGRRTAMQVVGPPGTRTMTDHFMAAWADDIRVRTEGLERGQRNGQRVAVHETSGGVVYDSAGVRITAVRAWHGSWPVALGYVVEAPGRRMVISGDARPSPAIESAAHHADVLVHEVYPAVRLKREDRPGGDDWPKYMKSFHTSDEELGAMAMRAGVRLLVITHVVRMGGTDDEILAGIRRGGYDGRVLIAKDLDHF
jgi:ribonuclease BN (tRNA processing enzyme)